MVVTDEFEALFPAQRIIEVHGSPARDHKDVTHPTFYQLAADIVG
jgi:hypothetical protein